MAELGNWVILKPGVPVKLHFRAHKIVPREIMDATFGVTRTLQSLMLLCDEEDGRKVDKVLSVLSQKLMSELSGYLEGDRYQGYTFTVIKDAPGTVAPRVVEITPR